MWIDQKKVPISQRVPDDASRYRTETRGSCVKAIVPDPKTKRPVGPQSCLKRSQKDQYTALYIHFSLHFFPCT